MKINKIQIVKYIKKTIILILSLVLLISLYVLTLKGKEGNVTTGNLTRQSTKAASPFESSHERATFAETISLVKNDKFTLTQALANFGSPDVGLYKNKFYSLFPPGVSILLIPLYSLGQKYGLSQLTSYATIPIIAIFSLIILYKISKEIFKLPPSLSLFSSLTFGFASFAWTYSITIYQHVPTVFLMLVAFYTGFKLKNSDRFGFIWGAISWSTIGISIFFDYPNVLLMFPLIIYLLSGIVSYEKLKEKIKLNINLTKIITFIFFVSGIGLYFIFSHAVYAKWFQTTNTIHRYDLNNKTTLLSLQQTNVSNVFKEDRVFQGLYLLTVAPEKGIFIFSPILILSILGALTIVKKSTSETWLLLAMPLTNLLVYASFGDPWGGWAFGPRYLIPSIPFLVILTTIWIWKRKHIYLKKIVAFVLFMLSAAISIGGALTTNLVPPKVEADYLHIPFGLAVTWNNIIANQSSSYIYNAFLSSKITLIQYGLVLFALTSFAAFVLLFLIPTAYED